MSNLKNVYVTKLAFTSGVKMIPEATICENVSLKMIEYKESGYTFYVHKPYWHITRQEAEDQVQKMLDRRIASIQKSMDKLKKFDVKKAVP